jgi:hypothetical protein
MVELFLYKSHVYKDSKGRPLWIRCSSENSCIQMHNDKFEVKKIVFEGEIPPPTNVKNKKKGRKRKNKESYSPRQKQKQKRIQRRRRGGKRY